MPSTRHVSKEHPPPTLPNPKQNFEFPTNSHLLITTPSHIFAWDSTGTHTIFRSSKSGIVAAREAKDGSGVLAVANKHVVVLHDTKRGQEKSWGLNAEDDEVRHLEYTADAKSLFLSTSLNTDIQHYSTERSRLLSPTKTHDSPLAALAVSPTGHLMVSASEAPPVVYLQSLTHNSKPVLLETRASDAAIRTVSFHPERPNIFLLAFRDGVLAAYDATRIGRAHTGSFSNQEHVNSCEIGHLRSLHRTNSDVKSTSISGASFLPGYKTRAISVGGDGQCRLVDFANGGSILRTWHAQAPVTSVSVLSLKTGAEERNRSASSRNSYLIGGPTSTNNLIAVGRTDGKIHIYDSLGLLLSQRNVNENGERVVSVEWAKGSSPKPIHESVIAQSASVTHPLADTELQTKKEVPTMNAAQGNGKTLSSREATTYENIGLPPALRRPKAPASQPGTVAKRRFTIHPDEIEEGTVRHTPSPMKTKARVVGTERYLDLFSPVKPQEAKDMNPVVKRLASPPRTRPKISSQTFIKSPEPTAPGPRTSTAKPRNLTLFPSTDSGVETPRESARKGPLPGDQVGLSHVPSSLQRRQITFKPSSVHRARKAVSPNKARTLLNNNAKVLADLRQMSATHPALRSGGVLSAFGQVKNDHQTSTPPASACERRGPHIFHRPDDHIETDLDSDNARTMYEHVHWRHQWPEDSTQASSLKDDIWLTSESDGETMRSRRRRKRQPTRPPARQTSRSRIDENGTMSTTATRPYINALVPQPLKNAVDGSTEDEMFTAQTHLSANGTLSPSSNDVRELFPRSSSLSPRKRKSPQRQRAHQCSPPSLQQQQQEPSLREIALNTAHRQVPRSPWARAKAGKIGKEQVDIFEDHGPTIRENGTGTVAASSYDCATCLATTSQVHNLEGEVARLRGEVLALKAALRRNGIPIPASLRCR